MALAPCRAGLVDKHGPFPTLCPVAALQECLVRRRLEPVRPSQMDEPFPLDLRGLLDDLRRCDAEGKAVAGGLASFTERAGPLRYCGIRSSGHRGGAHNRPDD